MTPLLAKTLVRNGHVRSFEVRSAASAGWEASKQEDHRLTEQQHCSDWHRVERTLTRFTRAIAELSEQGWLTPDAATDKPRSVTATVAKS